MSSIDDAVMTTLIKSTCGQTYRYDEHNVIVLGFVLDKDLSLVMAE